MTSAGGGPEENNYRMGGVSINDFNNAAPGSVMGGDMGVDAVQEFSVLTSNVSAEYGRTSGGVINAVTKSGTNQFHGGVYEFLRNDHLDAANFFENAGGIKKASFRQNQFGVSAGGPIRKDKLFVFGDYEGLRYSKGIPTFITVPSDAARLGILNGGTALDPTAPCAAEGNGATSQNLTATLPTTDPNYGKATVCVDDNAAKYLPFWPRATSTPAGSDTGSFTFSAPRVVTENFETVRVDDKLSDKDSLSATYLGDITPYSAPDALDDVLLSSRTNRQIGILEETHTFRPTLVNTVRFGFSRDAAQNNVGVTAINSMAKDLSLQAVPGQFAAQVVVANTLTQFTGGLGANGPGRFHWNSFQGYDDAFWTHGTHTIKFGGAVERMQLNMDQLSESSGTFNFSGLSNFLTNHPKKFTAARSANPTEGLRQTLFGVYVQDDWRARPNLTLNLGLRYEMTTVIRETSGKLANLRNITDQYAGCGVLVVPGCSSTGPFFKNPTLKNFEPRIGFAWDPRKNGKTAVRGGIGMFDVLPLPYQYILLATQASPFFSYTVLKTKDFPNVCAPQGCPTPFFNFGGLDIQFPANRLRTTYTDPNPKRTYVMQWNLNVQQQLTPSLAAMVAYVGSRGVHQPFRVDDANLVIPTKTSS